MYIIVCAKQVIRQVLIGFFCQSNLLHLIEGLPWTRIASQIERQQNPEISCDERTLQRLQAKAIKRIHDFVAANFDKTSGCLIAEPGFVDFQNQTAFIRNRLNNSAVRAYAKYFNNSSVCGRNMHQILFFATNKNCYQPNILIRPTISIGE